MHRSFQLSLLGTGQGKGYLFGRGVLDKYLDQHRTTVIPDERERVELIKEWLESLRTTTATESTLEQKFVSQILCGVLGYSLYPASPGHAASIYNKPGSKETGIRRTPDAALGSFTSGEHLFTGVVELKTPGTDLDEPQPSYGYETPVEQGFHYGTRILGTRWVIVSDMRVIRLYAVQNADEYEEFELDRCVESR
jgi:hypothetical protein